MHIEKRWLVVILLFCPGLLGSLLSAWGSGPPPEWRGVLTGLYFLPVTAAALVLDLRAALVVALASGATQLIFSGLAGLPWTLPLADSLLFVGVAVVAGKLAAPRHSVGGPAQKRAEVSLSTREAGVHGSPRPVDSTQAFADLAAGLVRRFRNPVMSIQGASWLLESAEDVSKKDIIEFTGIIRREARQLEVALANIGEFTHPRKPRFKTAALKDLLDRAVAATIAPGQDDEITCSVRVSPQTLKLEGSPDLLLMLFECLLLNAVQAMPGGGQIDVSADEAADGGVTVVIADSGGGLAPGTADRVFDPFFTTRESGLGLGLTLARQITAAHGGNIEIRDGSEAGAVVIVTLPQDHRRD